MRMPIVQFPDIVEKNLSYFAPVFHTQEQLKHFREYVTGLIVGDKKTVAAINALYLNNNDQSSLNKFLTQAKWCEHELNYLRVRMELARLNWRPVSSRAGRLIVDDTLAHHTKSRIEELAYLKDHTLNRYVWAHDVVTSYYVNRSDQFPMDFRLYLQFRRKKWRAMLEELAAQLQGNPTQEGYRRYLVSLLTYRRRQKEFRSKSRLAAELVNEAIAWRLPFDVVLFDGWFNRKPLIQAIQEAGKDWIGGCPANRLVLYKGRWMQLQEFIATIPAEAYKPFKINNRVWWAFTKVLPMKALSRQKVRFVATYASKLNLKETPTFYSSNRKDWKAKRILSTYLDRWPTETFNEDVKGHLGFEDYQLRRLRGIKRHWYLSFVAYSLLSDQGPPGRSRWAVKGQFDSTGQRRQAVIDELLEHLVYWIAEQLANNSPESVLQTLLAA